MKLIDNTQTIIYLALLLGLGSFVLGQPLRMVVGVLMIIVAVASDLCLNYQKTKKLTFKKSTLVSALILALIFDTLTHPYLALVVAVLPVLIEHYFKFKGWDEPLNFVATSLVAISLFVPVVSWWAVTWGLIPVFLILFFGIFILYQNKLFNLVVSFLASFIFILFLGSLLGETNLGTVGSFISLFLFDGSLFFFASLILTQPIFSLYSKPRNQIVFGLSVGLLAAIFSLMPRFWPLRDMDAFLLALVIGSLLVRSRFLSRLVEL